MRSRHKENVPLHPAPLQGVKLPSFSLTAAGWAFYRKILRYVILFINLFIYFYFEREWKRESAWVGERSGGRKRKNPKQALHSARNPMRGWTPQPWDHDLSWNQVRYSTDWATQAPRYTILIPLLFFLLCIFELFTFCFCFWWEGWIFCLVWFGFCGFFFVFFKKLFS